MSRRVALFVIAACLTDSAVAETLSTDGSTCGGNAYSSAQVIEGRPARRGPLTSVPDTLCADLEAPRSSTRIEIYGVPGQSGAGGVGSEDGSAPYDGGQQRGRPSGPPRRGY